jgi:hypothetical protein
MLRRSMLLTALAALGSLFALGCASQSKVSPGAVRGEGACCCCCCDPNCAPGCCEECPPDCKSSCNAECKPGCCDAECCASKQ